MEYVTFPGNSWQKRRRWESPPTRKPVEWESFWWEGNHFPDFF